MNVLRALRHFCCFTAVALAASLPAVAQAAPASENWEHICSRCHGANGDGHTPMGAKLKIKNYTDPKVQEEFTDSGLLKNLLLGINASDGTERMPAQKGRLTVTEAKDLVALIRSFKQSTPNERATP